MPHATDRRRSAPVLRGDRLRHPGDLRARIRRRPSKLGAADAAFRPALSRDHLCRARLSAVRRAGGRGEVFAGARGGRHRRRARPSADRQGACGRAVDGRLRHAAFRLPPPGAARCRWWWRGAATAPSRASATGSAPRPRRSPRSFATQGMAVFAEKYAYGPTRVQFENKDPRGFAEFKAQLAEHSALGARNTQLGRAAGAAVTVRSGGSDEGADGADAGADRR